MIEVIYNEGETSEVKKRKQLPRNIRQVGRPGGMRKIYIEDYVVTYLNQLAMPTNPYVRGAILVGSYENVNDTGALFISGAVEAQNVEFDLDETIFTNETWTNIYKTIKEYFPDLEVVGWFLSRLGFSTTLNEKIIRTHIQNFSGKNMTLYMIDALECEDTFYLYEQDELTAQNGYYIYYEKNEAMQNYMICQNKGKTTESQGSNLVDEKLESKFNRNDVVEQTLPMKEEKSKKEKKSDNVMYAASLILIVVMLGVGISSINHYDKLKSLESKVSGMVSVKEEQEKTTTISELPDANTEKRKVVVKEESKPKDTQESVSQSTEPSEAPTATENLQATNQESSASTQTQVATTENVVEASSNIDYYIVQPGDTLESICMVKYQNRSAIDTVIAANQLTDMNRLYPGQQLLLPRIIVQ